MRKLHYLFIALYVAGCQAASDITPEATPLLHTKASSLEFSRTEILNLTDLDIIHPTKIIRADSLFVILTPKSPYRFAVYNTRSAVMKWHGGGELKAMQQCEELARRNAGVDALNGAILFGQNGTVALETLMEARKAGYRDYRIDRIYPAVHFVPLEGAGKSLLRFLTIPALFALR